MLFYLKQLPRYLFRWFCGGLSLLSLSLVLCFQPAKALLPPLQLSPSAALTETQTTHLATNHLATNVIPNVDQGASLDDGRRFYQAGRFAEAIASWQTAAQTYRDRGDSQNEVLTLSHLALAHQELNQTTAAQQAIAQSLQLLEKAQPPANAPLWAQVLNAKAQLLFNQGQEAMALETWQQAQHYYEQANDPIGRMGTQINQAQALQKLGFYRRAKQQLEGLGKTLAALPDNSVKFTGLQALGHAWQNVGSYRDAETSFSTALDLAQKQRDQAAEGTILLSLGQLAIQMDDPNTAFDDLAAAEKLMTSPLRKVQTQVKQLRLMVDYDREDMAQKLAPKLQQAIQALPPSHASVDNAVNFAASLNRMKRPISDLPPQKLNQFIADTVKVARQIGDAQAEAYALHEWSRLYERHQQWGEAAQVGQQALSIARPLQQPALISQTAWQLGRVQQHQGDRVGAIRSYEEAVSALQAIRGDLVAANPDLQFSFRESVEPVYRELVTLLLNDRQPSQQALARSRELIEALQVAEMDNFFREACLDQAQQIDQIDPKATVIYPIILPDRLAVILSQAGQPLRYYATPKSKADIDRTLSDALAALNPITGKQARIQSLQTLYDLLIRPAEADQAFKGTETLVFVLDGKLRNIPMAALYDGQKYLIEKYAVTLSPGMQLLANATLPPDRLKAIIAGISESRNGFTALPAVEQEIKAIATAVGTQPLVNQGFTRMALSERVQTQDNAVNLVHLATHGQFSSRLEDTFLLTWDGPLNIKELSELLKTREGQNQVINLLVLSACETAAGDDRSVLGLAGLAVKSGARSTLASLWPVKDKVASRLMSQFYVNLKRPHTTKAEALRQAQLDLIQHSDFKHPFFWSAFVLVGHWQ